MASEVRFEYTTNAGDLFRASVGLAISHPAGSRFLTDSNRRSGDFFLAIDEKQILLQTSPLLIGLPLLAVGGQLLRLHAASRKYVSSLSSSQRQNRFAFSDVADGIDMAYGDSTGHISWNDIQRVIERRKTLLVFLNKHDVRLIPKGAIRDMNQIQILRNILSAKLGSRAHLVF
jgi:YcxB-like protein